MSVESPCEYTAGKCLKEYQQVSTVGVVNVFNIQRTQKLEEYKYIQMLLVLFFTQK